MENKEPKIDMKALEEVTLKVLAHKPAPKDKKGQQGEHGEQQCGSQGTPNRLIGQNKGEVWLMKQQGKFSNGEAEQLDQRLSNQVYWVQANLQQVYNCPAPVAQRIERFPTKKKVASSNLVRGVKTVPRSFHEIFCR